MSKSSPIPLNFKPSTIFTGDNLHIMRGMNSECVDLIYLDPPFNSDADYAAPIGSKAAGAEFTDTWTLQDIDVQWLDSIKFSQEGLWYVLKGVSGIHSPSRLSYLIYMIPRLTEMKRLLKPTGSIYLHCDPTASHYLKLVMDAIFGKDLFRNEIIWCYPPKGVGQSLGYHRKHDVILYYGASDHGFFERQYTPLSDKQKAKFSKTDENGRKYKEFKGKRTYLDESPGRAVPSWWDDIAVAAQSKKEYMKYPTQKSVALLKRIISASSRKDDLVLDPFCGCATTCVAAQVLDRKWVGIDVSPIAADLVDIRLREQFQLFQKCIRRDDIPQRTDMGKILKYNSKENKQKLYGLQEGLCNGCEVHFELRNFQVDHKVPQEHGGTDHISNLQLLCSHCNQVKGTKSQEQLKARLAELGIL